MSGSTMSVDAKRQAHLDALKPRAISESLRLGRRLLRHPRNNKNEHRIHMKKRT